MTDKREERIAGLLRFFADVADTDADTDTNPDAIVLPTPALMREALTNCLHVHSGKWKRTTPRWETSNVANVFHKIVRWHNGTGYLGGLMMARLDCARIENARGLERGTLFEELQTMALCLYRGNSRALNAWNSALVGRVG